MLTEKSASRLNFNSVSSLEILYKGLSRSASDESMILLMLRGWFNSVLRSDPFTGRVLNDDFDRFLSRCFDVSLSNDYISNDYLKHLLEYVWNDIEYILENPRSNIKRAYHRLPFRDVRETDRKTFDDICRMEGRNVRDKILRQRNILAVKREFSVDTQENRLFKKFLVNLLNRLESRRANLSNANIDWSNDADNYILRIKSYLRSENAKKIGMWRGEPPNNVLLQDSHYRKIWKSYIHLERIDSLVAKEASFAGQRMAVFFFFNFVMNLKRSSCFRLEQKPLLFDSMMVENEEFNPCLILSGYFFKKEPNHNPVLFVCTLFGSKITVEFDNVKESFSFENGVLSFGDNSISLSLQTLTDIPQQLAFRFLCGCGFDREYKFPILKGKSAYIDLGYVSPRVMLSSEDMETSSVEKLPVRLMFQRWARDDHSIKSVVPLSLSDAVVFSKKGWKIDTFSLATLSEHSKDHSDDFGAFADAIEIASQMKLCLDVKRSTIAFPDREDSFVPDPFQSAISSSFLGGKLIPSSIAASVWSLLNSRADFISDKVLLVVADATLGSLTLTPVLCVYDSKLLDAVPETRGISFIRYPAKTFGERYLEEKYSEGLCCTTSLKKKLLELNDPDSLVSDARNISYSVESEKYEHPFLKNMDSPCVHKLEITQSHIKELKESLGNSAEFSRISVLSLKKYIDLGLIEKTYLTDECTDNIPNGLFSLESIQKKLNGESVWSDYLPDLIMLYPEKGSTAKLNLIRNKKIKPVLNEPVPIDVKEHFILSKGKKFYHFPLLQGIGMKKLTYEALVESDNFPLESDVECCLNLSYIYGGSQPYRLIFVPVKEKQLGVFNVQWKKSDEIPLDLESLKVPTFVDIPKVSDLRCFYDNKKGTSHIDLVNIYIRQLENLLMQVKIESGITEVSKTNRYLNVKTASGRILNVYYEDSRFIEKELKRIEKERNVYYIEDKSNKLLRGFVTNTPKIRLNIVKLFNSGLKSEDIGQDLNNQAKKFTLYVQSLIEDLKTRNGTIEDRFVYECLYHISAMNRVIPEKLNFLFKNDFIEKMSRWDAGHRVLAMLLQDCSTVPQRELFSNLFKYIENWKNDNRRGYFGLRVISIALWRNRNFINYFDADLMRTISFVAVDHLNKFLLSLDERYFDTKKIKYSFKEVLKCFELFLGFLRSRSLLNPKISAVFAPASDLSVQILKLIKEFQRLSRTDKYHDFLKSKLEIEGVKVDNNDSVLLRTLEVYLRSEDSASSIRIVGTGE
jgi:hypothetical protein